MAILNTALANVKDTLRRIELIRILSRAIRNVVASREEISELSRLIEQDRMVVVKPCLQVKRNEMGRMVVHDTVKEYLKTYRTVLLRKTKADRLAIPAGAVLLRYPLALLAIPSAHEEYLKAVGAKTRNMIRKAGKEEYDFREFDWNDYLDDIFKINTSKEVRSGGKMTGWYLEPVKPRYPSSEELYYKKFYGIFKEGHLWAYLHLVLCGDFAFFETFIGHADHLKYGIMNYLVSSAVREYVGHSHIKWFSYGIFPAGSSGATIDFRKRAGFESYATFLDLEDDQELLKYSRHVRVIGLTSV